MPEATDLDLARVRGQLISEVERIADDSRHLERHIDASADHLVTSLDKHIHAKLCETLPQILDVDILSEEESSLELSSDLIWIIDPIDGTANAAVGSDEYAISVALYSRISQRGLVGLVHLPEQRVTFSASIEDGAFENERALRTKDLNGAPSIFAIGIPANPADQVDLFINRYKYLLTQDVYIRQSGSAAIDVCRVAQSQWKGFHQYGVRIWDIAAADVIARAAGCQTYKNASSTHSSDAYTLDYLVLNPYYNSDFDQLISDT